jgi:cell wall-associated NlpC family hydrolase
VRVVAAKLAKAAGATAVGITAGFVGSSTPAVSSPTNLAAAEQVASQFVRGFEGFSYADPDAKASVADLATARLAALLRSPSQASTGPALVAEKFVATANVDGFEVESDSTSDIDLLARTDIRVSTTTGSSSSERLIPVSLVDSPAGWKVDAIDGLTVSPPVSTTTTTVPTAVTPDAGSTAPAVTDDPGATGSAPTGPVTAVGDVPASFVAWAQQAVAAECPGLSWTVLAGIAKVESDFGESTLPGVRSGSNPMGAEGPMQFEPATFAVYGTTAPGGVTPPSPYDAADAIFSAARLLCADGGGSPAHLYGAIFAYNHSDAYVSLVLAYANEYAQIASDGSPSGTVERGLGSVIVAEAETYLGTEYVWGGENPKIGFDCSGLVQWVYAEAGLSLPRVAQDQYDHGPHLPAGATLYPGDLVFFGSGPTAVEHVGIYVGNGDMIDAPYTGAVVRFDRVASVPLGYVGATRPEIPDMTTGAGVPVVSSAYPIGGGSGGGGGHQGGGQSNQSGGGAHRGGTGAGTGAGTGSPHRGHHHATTTTSSTSPTTSTTVPSTTAPPTSTPPRRHHGGTTTTTDPTTTTTDPPVTTVPPTTVAPSTTVASTTPTTTVPPSTTTTASAGTSSEPTTTAPPARRHHR